MDSKSQYVNPFRCEIRKTALEAPQAPKILKLAVTNTVSMQNVKQNVTRCVPRSARASGHLSTRNSATRKPATLHTCIRVSLGFANSPRLKHANAKSRLQATLPFTGLQTRLRLPLCTSEPRASDGAPIQPLQKTRFNMQNPNVQSPCAPAHPLSTTQPHVQPTGRAAG